MDVKTFFYNHVSSISEGYMSSSLSSDAVQNSKYNSCIFQSLPSENDSSGTWCKLRFSPQPSESLINKVTIHIDQYVTLEKAIDKIYPNTPWSRNLSYGQDRIYNRLKQYCFQTFITQLQKDKVIAYYPQGCHEPLMLIYDLSMKNNSSEKLYGVIRKENMTKFFYTTFSFITEKEVPKIPAQDEKNQSKKFDYITSFRHWSGGAHCRRLLPYARSATEIVELIRQSEKYWVSHPECEVPFIFRDSSNLSRNYSSVILPLLYPKVTNSRCDLIIIASIIFETYISQGQMVYQLRSILDLQSAWMNTVIANGIDCINSHPQWNWVIPKEGDDFLSIDTQKIDNTPSIDNRKSVQECADQKIEHKDTIDSKGMIHGKVVSMNSDKCEIISDGGIAYTGNTSTKFAPGNRIMFYPNCTQSKERRALLIRLESI